MSKHLDANRSHVQGSFESSANMTAMSRKAVLEFRQQICFNTELDMTLSPNTYFHKVLFIEALTSHMSGSAQMRQEP